MKEKSSGGEQLKWSCVSEVKPNVIKWSEIVLQMKFAKDNYFNRGKKFHIVDK